MMTKRRRGPRGFSLIELLIAIAIFAIVVSMSLPVAQKVLDSASETAVAREMQTIHQAQIQYLTLYGSYAARLGQLGPPAAGPPAGAAAPGYTAVEGSISECCRYLGAQFAGFEVLRA